MCGALQVEVRKRDTGQVVYRDHLSCAVSAVMAADYRGDGTQQAVVCGCEGEVGVLVCVCADTNATAGNGIVHTVPRCWVSVQLCCLHPLSLPILLLMILLIELLYRRVHCGF
jgi:hypothetical protein